MPSFHETFTLVEKNLRPHLAEIDFVLHQLSVTGEDGTHSLFGSARYGENIRKFQRVEQKRFVCLSTAPLRLEIDLDFGIGDQRFGLQELFLLQASGDFPARQHDLYTAMHEPEQLQAEFERLLRVLIDYGQRFFDNDVSLWSDLQSQRLQRTQTTRELELIKKTEAAFAQQNWGAVIELLRSREAELNPLNRKRLAYARKKLNA